MKKLVPKQWIKSKNESDLKIELVNESTIELKGTDNAMALRGRSLSGVVLDEAAFMDREVWSEVIRPALADKDRKSTRLNSSHEWISRMPSSA